MTENHDSHWEIISGKLHGELSKEEGAEFSKMLSENPDQNEFKKTQQIYDRLKKAGSISANEKVESWAKVENEITKFQLQGIKTVLKYVAFIVTAFIAGNLLKPYAPKEKEIRYSEMVVPFGQMSQLILSDGTKIWLNSGTTIRYPEQFGKNSRSVFISGEAYFEVAKIPSKPFTINTSDMKVEVLGTSFNLIAYKEDAATSVTLVEGKVAVQNCDGKTIALLSPGQMATKIRNETNVSIQNVETGFYSAWIAGKIFFDDEPLDQIAVKLERWFNVEIAFSDEHLKSLRFTGTILKNKPVDQIMQALELLSPIRFKHQVNANGKDKITIYKRT